MKPMIRIHDLITDTVEDREMTTTEFKEYKLEEEKAANEQAEAQAKIAARAAILDRLGLTADEAAILLG